jgi:hypothetical protein
MPARGIAETARLIASLELKDKLGPGIASATRSLGKLETRLSRIGSIASKGMATAARNIATIGLAAAGAVVGLVALSVKEGQEAARVQLVYAKAIENSGKVTADYVGILNEQQLALMNLAGIDDELIKAEQTKLIQMGLTGKQVADLTPLILDMSKATGKDLVTSTIAVGKAANGTATGLQRFGVFVDKAKFKVDPFAATMEALNEKFGGTTKALSGTLEARLGALREGLANIREEAGIKLLPALTHIVDVVGKAVVPAFGKLIDRIMPGITAGIDDLAKALEGGGAERAIGGIADALGTMIGLLEAAAGPVKAIVGAFMSLPKELQTILVAGFAVNKLTGGMVTQLAGEILFKRGGSPANPLFVADVTGGLGGGAGKGIGGALTSLPVLLGGAALVAALAAVQSQIIQPGLQAQADANASATEKLLRTGSLADLRNALRGLEGMPGELDPLKKVLYDLNANGVKTHTETLEEAIRAEIASREKTAAEVAAAARKVATAEARVAIAGRAEKAGKAKPTEAAIDKTALANLARAITGKDPYTGKELPSGALMDKLANIWKPRLDAIAKGAQAQAIATRAQSILQTVANMRLATIAGKDFSPRVTVPVTVYSTVSVRGLGVAQTVRASYTRTAGSALKGGVA